MEPNNEQPKHIEQQPKTPTEASKGFLHRIVKEAKKVVFRSTPGGAAVANAFPESTDKMTEQGPTPTEGSKGFLKDWFNQE